MSKTHLHLLGKNAIINATAADLLSWWMAWLGSNDRLQSLFISAYYLCINQMTREEIKIGKECSMRS